ncbi:MAG: SCO family protein [Lysobacteraceae bacterium]
MIRSRSGAARLPLILVLAAALAAGLGLWAGARFTQKGEGSAPAMQAALLFPAPREVPPFSLDLPGGEQLDAARLQGRWSLVFVGFTHCPDICPVTLALLGEVEKQLADLPLQIVFVSVDPERDSAERTSEYAGYFSANALGATADHARLTPFARSLGMVYMQSELDNGDYTVDHSASIAILDPQTRWVGLFRPPLDAARIAADLKTLAERG